MNRLFAVRNHAGRGFEIFPGIRLCALLLCFSLGALAQNTASATNTNATVRIRARHILGLETTKSNCNGTLSIQDDALQFQRGRKPPTQVKLDQLRNVSLGTDSKQVGGVPMTLGKMAAPYGSSRVISLFTHKKYDTVTVEYVDSDGGFHAALFQLNKGQGELVKRELVARGVPFNGDEDEPTKQTAEVKHEGK